MPAKLVEAAGIKKVQIEIIREQFQCIGIGLQGFIFPAHLAQAMGVMPEKGERGGTQLSRTLQADEGGSFMVQLAQGDSEIAPDSIVIGVCLQNFLTKYYGISIVALTEEKADVIRNRFYVRGCFARLGDCHTYIMPIIVQGVNTR